MMFDLTADEARLLLNIAMMAVGANRFKSAAKIFAVLERFRPEAPQVAAGQVLALLSAQCFAEALVFLDETALRKFPDDPMLLAFKGMALLRLNRISDAQAPLEKAAAQTKDLAAAKLAEDLLK